MALAATVWIRSMSLLSLVSRRPCGWSSTVCRPPNRSGCRVTAPTTTGSPRPPPARQAGLVRPLAGELPGGGDGVLDERGQCSGEAEPGDEHADGGGGVVLVAAVLVEVHDTFSSPVSLGSVAGWVVGKGTTSPSTPVSGAGASGAQRVASSS